MPLHYVRDLVPWETLVRVKRYVLRVEHGGARSRGSTKTLHKENVVLVNRLPPAESRYQVDLFLQGASPELVERLHVVHSITASQVPFELQRVPEKHGAHHHLALPPPRA